MPALRRHHGFTLLEAAIVIAVLGIIAAVAVPSYGSMLARQQLRAAGAHLALDLRIAREEALRSGRSVFVSSRGSGAAWCWGVSRDSPCDCQSGSTKDGQGGAPACSVGRGEVSDYPLVELGRADTLEFQPGLGRALSAGTVELKTRKKHSLQVQVNVLGRAHLCGPDAPKPVDC